MNSDLNMTLAQYQEHSDNNDGFCTHCGAEQYGVEPDAKGYECDECGRCKVYGLDELLLMGLITITEEV